VGNLDMLAAEAERRPYRSSVRGFATGVPIGVPCLDAAIMASSLNASRRALLLAICCAINLSLYGGGGW